MLGWRWWPHLDAGDDVGLGARLLELGFMGSLLATHEGILEAIFGPSGPTWHARGVRQASDSPPGVDFGIRFSQMFALVGKLLVLLLRAFSTRVRHVFDDARQNAFSLSLRGLKPDMRKTQHSPSATTSA